MTHQLMEFVSADTDLVNCIDMVVAQTNAYQPSALLLREKWGVRRPRLD